MREVTVKEAIEELGLPCEVRKAPSNIPYVIHNIMSHKAVSARRKRVDNTLGPWTAFILNKFGVDAWYFFKSLLP